MQLYNPLNLNLTVKNIIFLIILIQSLFSQQNSIAVIDFDNINIRKTDADALSQRLTSELINLNNFTVLERSLIHQVMEEQKFQYSGAVDSQTISDIGSMIGADYVVIGSISKIGGIYFSIDARMIEVKSSKSIKSANYDGNDLGDLLKKGMENIAFQLSDIDISNTQTKSNKSENNKAQYSKPETSTSSLILLNNDKTESWYYYLSYSLATNYSYPNELETYIADYEYLTDNREKGSIELIGIYTHLKPKIIGGIVYDFANDIINYDYINYNSDIRSLTLSHSFIGFSLIGYFTEFGDGIFYKFDIGSASIDYTLSVIGGDDTNISENGTGYGLGFGYSYYMKALKKTRVFISYNISIRNIDLTNSTVPILEDFYSYRKNCINFGIIF